MSRVTSEHFKPLVLWTSGFEKKILALRLYCALQNGYWIYFKHIESTVPLYSSTADATFHKEYRLGCGHPYTLAELDIKLFHYLSDSNFGHSLGLTILST